MPVFIAPPIEAQPGPLPDSGPFLRIFWGADQPTTTMMRAARELIGVWRHLHDHGRLAQEEVEERLALLIWVIDREAKGLLGETVSAPNAPFYPKTYGDMVADLAWHYTKLGLRQDTKPDVSREQYDLVQAIERLNTLSADVMAGRVRVVLPEK